MQNDNTVEQTEEQPEQKLYKFAPHSEIKKLFNSIDVSEITYKNRLYKRDSFMMLLSTEPFGVGKLEELFTIYPYLDGRDFTELESRDSTFDKSFKKLMEEVSELPLCNITDAWLLTLTYTDYTTSPKFLIDNKGKIFVLNDNACSGIDMNLASHIKNKRGFLRDLNYKLELIVRDELLEEVSKYYYYQADYENSSGTGAGTLTGWITQEEADRRAKNKTLIKLNNNFRIKK